MQRNSEQIDMALTINELSEHFKSSPEGLVINKSRAYLGPSLSLYDDVAIFSSQLHLFATAIWDDSYGKFQEDHFFMLFTRTPFLEKKLSEIRKLEWYVDDYIPDGIMERNFHMVIVQLPIKGLTTKFIEGKYSELYDEELAYKLFIERYSNRPKSLQLLFANSYNVITKKEAARQRLENTVNQLVSSIGAKKGYDPFGDNTRIKIQGDQEYELYNPFLEEEVFNYGREHIDYGSFKQRQELFIQ